MEIVTVWLLVISGIVNGGELTHIVPQSFADLAACEQVKNNLPSYRNERYGAVVHHTTRCVQTRIMVKK